jgi:hypothetical protein
MKKVINEKYMREKLEILFRNEVKNPVDLCARSEVLRLAMNDSGLNLDYLKFLFSRIDLTREQQLVKDQIITIVCTKCIVLSDN